MTLNQLKVFVMVVRLGSFRAAADALGVSEPAVSQAVTALRQSLGDPLFGRGQAGIELTPAGQRVIGIASQMVGLAVQAEDAVRQAQGGAALLRVSATATPAEMIAPALLQAFTRRVESVEANLGVATPEEMRALLAERLTDVAIGPRLDQRLPPGTTRLVSEPLLRYRLVIVAGRHHPLAGTERIAPRALAGYDWFVDAEGVSVGSETAALLQRCGVDAERIRVSASQRAAWAAAVAGDGVAVAVEHVLARDRPSGVVVLPVEGFPAEHLWYITMATGETRSPAAARLGRFLASPDATQAMIRADGSIPASRFKPPVHITIWS